MSRQDTTMAQSQPVLEQPRDNLQTDTLAASVIVMLLLVVMQRGIGFLRSVMFCKWLTDEQLGQWDMALGFIMLASPLIMLGIPGSFGRYVEYFRHRKQLKPFLRRVTATTAVSVLLAAVIALLVPRPLAEFVFGDADYAGLAMLTVACLVAVSLFNYLTTLLLALRQARVASLMHLLMSVLFAATGLSLLALRADSEMIVVAYAVASGVVGLMGIAWMVKVWRSLPIDSQPIVRGTLWARIAPFAFFLWMMNWLSNLFAIVDRLMIIHYGGFSPDEALAVVGQYHTARIFPMLFIGLAEMLAMTITPHLSSAWEAGRKDEVGERLGQLLKCVGLGLTIASLGVLLIAPLLFNTVWGGKYAAGLSVLPWTLALSVWAGMASVGVNYFWCAEKNRYSIVPVGVGLLANIGLNAVLLPPFGLFGAVLATMVSWGLAFLVQTLLAARLGMRYDSQLVAIAMLPIALGISRPVAAVCVVVLLIASRRVWLPEVASRLQGILAKTRLAASRESSTS